jgi:pilus assembly protein CpaC
VFRRNGLVVLLVFCLVLLFSGPAMAIQVKAHQSMLIDSTENIRRVAIAKPEIADVEVISPRQMLIIGKSAGTTTLIYWNEQEVATTVDLTIGINVDQAREDLQKIAPEDSFEVSGWGDTLVLSGTVGTEASHARLAQGAKAYAKNIIDILKVQQLEQILLQIRVSEVDRNTAKELGFSMLFRPTINGDMYRIFTSPGGGAIENIASPEGSFSSISNIFFSTPGESPKVQALIRALHEKGALKVLAEPNLIVANGDKGNFLVGGEFPVVIANAVGSGAAASVVYKEYGVKLHFEPRIASNGDIYIKLVQEVSELDFSQAVTVSGFTIPSLKSRKAETGLQLADGQTFVLAGLIDNKVSKKISKIPLLGDIPILGALFRSVKYSNDETELMVMVTPKIVRPLHKDEIPVLPSERIDPKEVNDDMWP